jgi:hypothetical protein
LSGQEGSVGTENSTANLFFGQMALGHWNCVAGQKLSLVGLLETHAMILAGDIGGTNTVIAYYEESGNTLRQFRAASRCSATRSLGTTEPLRWIKSKPFCT